MRGFEEVGGVVGGEAPGGGEAEEHLEGGDVAEDGAGGELFFDLGVLEILREGGGVGGGEGGVDGETEGGEVAEVAGVGFDSVGGEAEFHIDVEEELGDGVVGIAVGIFDFPPPGFSPPPIFDGACGRGGPRWRLMRGGGFAEVDAGHGGLYALRGSGLGFGRSSFGDARRFVAGLFLERLLEVFLWCMIWLMAARMGSVVVGSCRLCK